MKVSFHLLTHPSIRQTALGLLGLTAVGSFLYVIDSWLSEDKKYEDHRKVQSFYDQFIEQSQKSGLSPIHQAAIQGNLRVLAAPQHRGHLNDADALGGTPLAYAALRGNSQVIEHLLSQGVDPNHKIANIQTPLEITVLGGHLKATESLLKGKANPNVKNQHGMTPIHVAAASGHLELLKALHQAGGQLHPERKDHEVYQPIVYAIGHRHTKASTYLAKNGVPCTPLILQQAEHQRSLYHLNHDQSNEKVKQPLQCPETEVHSLSKPN
jgi:hypothetical protein